MNELFTVDVEKNYINLTPVEVEPRYTEEELAGIDRLVTDLKNKGKVYHKKSEAMAHLKRKH